MREFEVVIDEAFKNGLCPDRTIPFNSQVLYQCLGFRLAKYGLEPYLQLDNPIPGTFTMLYEWPAPQIIVGKNFNILMMRNTLNARDEFYTISNDMQTITSIYNASHTIYPGYGRLEMADFGPYIFFTSGGIMFYYDVTTHTWQKNVAFTNIPMMKTICNFKGRAVGGNIRSGTWYGCDSTYYIWSQIGCMVFTPGEMNEAGYARCPFGGEVYHVRRMGDVVVGYSSKGVTFLVPACDPAPAFGFKELSDIGLINQGAMDGDWRRQVYLGSDYVLREVTQEGVKELGYQWLMETLAGDNDVIISYEPINRDFYISNGSITFLLSPYGLTQVTQHPCTIWSIGNVSYMLPDTDDESDYLITSWPFDFGYRGQKTNFTVESDAIDFTSGYGGLDYLLNQTWKTASYSQLNNQGISSIIASGDAFRYRLKFESLDSDFKVGFIKGRYKMTDLRGIRGVYAPPIRGQG